MFPFSALCIVNANKSNNWIISDDDEDDDLVVSHESTYPHFKLGWSRSLPKKKRGKNR